jgi:hypothetical protein
MDSGTFWVVFHDMDIAVIVGHENIQPFAVRKEIRRYNLQSLTVFSEQG